MIENVRRYIERNCETQAICLAIHEAHHTIDKSSSFMSFYQLLSTTDFSHLHVAFAVLDPASIDPINLLTLPKHLVRLSTVSVGRRPNRADVPGPAYLQMEPNKTTSWLDMQ